MKQLFIFILIIWTTIGNTIAQPDFNFKKLDAYARGTPKEVSKNVQDLTTYLIRPARTELEKVRVIYTWIIYHIDYDKAAYRSDFYRINKSSEDILKRKKAICFGYAKLFEEMCLIANLPVEVILGYSKGASTSYFELDKLDHAWNAVQIDGNWHLLDLTWAAGTLGGDDNFKYLYQTDYFLTDPKLFITNHLPANPMWQLLTCPVPPETFKLSDHKIFSYQKNPTQPCISFSDSIEHYRRLSRLEKRILNMERAYKINPVESNSIELGQTYMDLEGEYADLAEDLQEQGASLDTLILLQEKMIALCKKASKFTNLYPNQVENCAYTYMNQGVALSKQVNQINNRIKEKDLLLKMLDYFQTAEKLLKELPPATFVTNGIRQCASMKTFTLEALERYD